MIFLSVSRSGVGWSRFVVFGEQSVQAVDARTPEFFEAVEQALRLADAIGVAPYHPLTTAWLLCHEPRLLQNCNVLLDCRERHLVGLRQLGHRDTGDQRATHDIAPRRVREGAKEAVDVLI